METQNGPCKDYSPFKRGTMRASMLVGESVCNMLSLPSRTHGERHTSSAKFHSLSPKEISPP